MVNAKIKELAIQLSKFIIVGVINTGIDFAVLNLLMLTTGYNHGLYFSLFKTVSFIVAVTNSYLMNKFWTFNRQSQTSHLGTQISQFLMVSLVGLAINVGIASFVVNIVPRPAFVSGNLWANLGTLAATGGALIWNFIGYKVFVFKKSSTLDNSITN